MSKGNLSHDCIPDWMQTLQNDPESAVQPLCEWLNDESESVQSNAIEALGKIYPSLNKKKLKKEILVALFAKKFKSNAFEIIEQVEKVLKEIKKKFPNDLM